MNLCKILESQYRPSTIQDVREAICMHFDCSELRLQSSTRNLPLCDTHKQPPYISWFPCIISLAEEIRSRTGDSWMPIQPVTHAECSLYQFITYNVQKSAAAEEAGDGASHGNGGPQKSCARFRPSFRPDRSAALLCHHEGFLFANNSSFSSSQGPFITAWPSRLC